MTKSNWPRAGKVGLCDIGLDQLEVGEPERFDPGTALVDLNRRQVETDRPPFGMPCGERDQVATRGTADLQHARRRDVGYVESEQIGHGGQMPRCGLRKRVGLVRRGVVVGPQLINRFVHLSPCDFP